MKLGKVKLRQMLSKETGIPVRDIIDYGRYEYFGNKERLEIGSYVIVAVRGEVKIWEPARRDTDGEEIPYRSRILEKRPCEAATSGA